MENPDFPLGLSRCVITVSRETMKLVYAYSKPAT